MKTIRHIVMECGMGLVWPLQVLQTRNDPTLRYDVPFFHLQRVS